MKKPKMKRWNMKNKRGKKLNWKKGWFLFSRWYYRWMDIGEWKNVHKGRKKKEGTLYIFKNKYFMNEKD